MSQGKSYILSCGIQEINKHITSLSANKMCQGKSLISLAEMETKLWFYLFIYFLVYYYYFFKFRLKSCQFVKCLLSKSVLGLPRIFTIQNLENKAQISSYNKARILFPIPWWLSVTWTSINLHLFLNSNLFVSHRMFRCAM